ncbi:MAG TPA: septum formation initiator family protein [Solirubrobacteraceae bacterium]|jgi:cell division protein FtsB|nr:septum formation initiator family protein [Solirubrobacteraceae bacterium]
MAATSAVGTRVRAGSRSAGGARRASGASARSAPLPRAVPLTAAGVRWDRLGRLALLCVLAALVYLYASAGVHLLSKVSQAHAHSAQVRALRREHALLVSQHEQLSRQSTLEAEARRLGMIKPGEQPFIATGLPND